MPKLDIPAVPVLSGTRYPPPHDAPCRERMWQALGLAGGLTQFGVNLMTLKPGVWSSQRHWHTAEDEFAYVLSGEVVLIDDSGEQTLKAGEAAAFPPEMATATRSSIAAVRRPRSSSSAPGATTTTATIPISTCS